MTQLYSTPILKLGLLETSSDHHKESYEKKSVEKTSSQHDITSLQYHYHYLNDR